MRLDEAIAMLDNSRFHPAPKMVWADLGCGSGTFTLALATLLPPESLIYATDNNASALAQIPSFHHDVRIEKYNTDFLTEALPFSMIDGIMMANALHYVENKAAFLSNIIGHLKEKGCFLVVEYNTNSPVPLWVPFPVSFHRLTILFHDMGYKNVQLLGERNSLYGNAPLYAAIVTE